MTDDQNIVGPLDLENNRLESVDDILDDVSSESMSTTLEVIAHPVGFSAPVSIVVLVIVSSGVIFRVFLLRG